VSDAPENPAVETVLALVAVALLVFFPIWVLLFD